MMSMWRCFAFYSQRLFVFFFVFFFFFFFFFSSRRRHTRCREVSWARRCVQETGINAEYMGKLKMKKRQSLRKLLQMLFLYSSIWETLAITLGLQTTDHESDSFIKGHTFNFFLSYVCLQIVMHQILSLIHI
eukprot:TRINITY_DN12133_c0_g1_i10.p1 TRINITY_DN12133_c0_g1~~TRINITY_DN12133_c0_g1_i10.p1  ORF type:complete len:132 (+),score=45.57 TRINITY_DN12133_c0_g1_i10:37-432(+)